MRERFDPDIDPVRLPRGEAITLVGPSGDLSGDVTLENATAANLVLRDATLHLGDRRGSADVRAIVAPGSTRTVRVRARLDGIAPAGVHEGTLVIAGRQHPVRVEVIERVRIEVVPGEILILAAPGTTTHHVAVVNRGDVDAYLAPGGPITLEAEPTTDEHAPRHVVEVRADPVSIPPGATAGIDLAVAIPDDLPAAPRWRGTVPFATADVRLVVTPGPASAPSPAQPARRPRARRAASPKARGKAPAAGTAAPTPETTKTTRTTKATRTTR